MKLPIPDDWDGKSWECIQIEWPSSTAYRGILLGFLSYLMRGRTYDENTGNIKAAQKIGELIFWRNRNLTPCFGTPENPPDYPSPGEWPCGRTFEGIEPCEECEDDMGCYIDALECRDGVIWYRKCGEWFPLVGDCGQADTPTTDDEITTPEGQEENWACRKATVVGNALFALGKAIDDHSDEALPIAYGGIKDDVGFDVRWYGLLDCFLWMQTNNTIYDSDIADVWSNTRTKALLICRLADKLDGSNNDLGTNQWDIIRGEVSGLLGRDPLKKVFALLVLETIGLATMRKLTRAIAVQTADTGCECPDETEQPPVNTDWAYVYDFRQQQYRWELIETTEGREWVSGIGYRNPDMAQFEHLPTIHTQLPVTLTSHLTYVALYVAQWPNSDNKAAIEWGKIPPVTVLFDEPEFWGAERITKVIDVNLPGNAWLEFFNGQVTSANANGSSVLWKLVIAGTGDPPFPGDPSANG